MTKYKTLGEAQLTDFSHMRSVLLLKQYGSFSTIVGLFEALCEENYHAWYKTVKAQWYPK